MDFAAADSNFRERVKDSFSRQGFMAHLGATLDVPSPGAFFLVLIVFPDRLSFIFVQNPFIEFCLAKLFIKSLVGK